MPTPLTLEFNHPRANVLGVSVSAIDMQEAVTLADRWILSGNRGYICVTGVHGVMEAQSDPEFRMILNRAFINTPDGMPMSWIGHLQGFKNMDRVYGPDFMIEVCRISVLRGYRHFLYGGNNGVAELLKEKLISKIPGLKITGTYTPPFRPLTVQEEEEFLTLVGKSQPDILWVGLSTPKQEKFMAKYVSRLNVPLLVGVGAAFDIHTGKTKDAPDWMKRAGMQWFHRLLQEPKRLGPRYLINNPRFLIRVALQFSRIRSDRSLPT